MIEIGEDQAAGLRALLGNALPEVLAVVPFGAASVHWVARQARQRAALGLRVLAFDEWQISGSFSDCIGVAPRFDLQQAAEGQVGLEDCVMQAACGVGVLAVARLARELDGSRILQQRVGDSLARLQAVSDEWLLIARPCDLAGLSSFARAAPRALLVVEPVERAITEAYAALKRLVRNADTSAVGVAVVGPDHARAELMARRLCRVAASQLGVNVQQVTSVGEAIGMPVPDPCNTAFGERLLAQTRSTAALEAMRSRVTA